MLLNLMLIFFYLFEHDLQFFGQSVFLSFQRYRKILFLFNFKW